MPLITLNDTFGYYLLVVGSMGTVLTAVDTADNRIEMTFVVAMIKFLGAIGVSQYTVADGLLFLEVPVFEPRRDIAAEFERLIIEKNEFVPR